MTGSPPAAVKSLAAAGVVSRLRCRGGLHAWSVLVETVALLQHRFGLGAVRGFQDAVAPVLTLVWVDADLHAEGTAALLTANRRELSLVDCVSFACMRRHGLTRAFHFGRHFRDQGFASA